MRKPFTTIVFLLILILASCTAPTTGDKIAEIDPLIGAWEMKEIHWKTADTTYSITNAQPGLLIISPEGYSTMWTPTQEPRVPFKNLSQPTDEETIQGFRSVVFNGGTYTKTDSTLTTTAQIAKVPGFEGGVQYYRYQIEDEKLRITMFDETYPDGSKPAWFGRYETEFVMERAKP